MFIPKFAFVAAVLFFSSSCFCQLSFVAIDLLPDSITQLESDPFHSPDVSGNFVGADGYSQTNAAINYRGAYQLKALIYGLKKEQRNWKIKVAKENPYRNRQEWNYNYEPHPRQVLAYYLMQKIGVKVPSCRHVLLTVNGRMQGIYSEYEDPDNKAWLKEKFDDNDGDLYKAAHDMPDEPRYFAQLDDLGDQNKDYFWHYNKKTNQKNEGEGDYSSLIALIKVINDTPDNEFVATLKQHFDTDTFIKYLVVANYASNWDSYPVRPKNYWLYQHPDTKIWTFIPWDLDATFQTATSTLNTMGASVSIFYQFDKYEEYDLQPQEGSERPLVRRMMKFPEFRNAYVAEYKKATNSFLNKTHIDHVLDSLVIAIKVNSPAADISEYANHVRDVKSFVTTKTVAVQNQLDNYSATVTDIIDQPNDALSIYPSVFPNPTNDQLTVRFDPQTRGEAVVEIIDLQGKLMNRITHQMLAIDSHQLEIPVHGLASGTYMIRLCTSNNVHMRRLVIQ